MKRLKELKDIEKIHFVGIGGAGMSPLANCIVSYVAALQYETFSSFHGYAIVTTMSTGNLRKFIDALYAGVVHRDTAKLRQALVFLSIIVTFTMGAFLGALGTDLWDRAAVMPAIACLALAIAVSLSSSAKSSCKVLCKISLVNSRFRITLAAPAASSARALCS